MVITLASHARGPGFETQRKQIFDLHSRNWTKLDGKKTEKDGIVSHDTERSFSVETLESANI